METRASHVLIGAFTLGVFVAALLFVLWIGKSSLDREWDEYDIVFREAVTGLTTGGAVQYNGLQLGEVRKLSLNPSNPGEVIARVRVAADTPVKADTRAKLTFTGLTGVAVIQLSGGSVQAPMLQVKPGESVPRIIADDSALQKIMSSSEDIVTSVNDMLFRISQILSETNIQKVTATLDHIEQVSGAISARSEGIGQAIADISEASRELKLTLAQTQQVLARLDRIGESAQGLIDGEGRELLVSARKSLDAAQRFADSAYAVVEQNRDSIESFSHQGLSQVGPAVTELRAALRKLSKLTDQLEEQPAAFLLGRDQPKEYDAR